jgi:hypothetical protein
MLFTMAPAGGAKWGAVRQSLMSYMSSGSCHAGRWLPAAELSR